MKIKIVCTLLTVIFLRTNFQAEDQSTFAPVKIKIGDSSRAIANSIITTNLDNQPYTPPEPGEGMIFKPINVDGKNPLPFEATVVETPETKEMNDISSQAAALFHAKDYDKLDALAAKYRSSKERYVSGRWKLNWVYNSLNISDDTSDAECESRLNILRDWIKVKPDSITARVALADALVSFAWKARGTGTIDTVSENGLRLFDARLHQAADVLAQAKKLKEQCPRYWSVLMRVGLGLGVSKSQFNAVFKQAIQSEPDYEYYYEARAIYLLPRWYGDNGEWENDLAQSADKIGGENGDMLYAQVAWGMRGQFDNVFAENRLSQARVEKGIEVMEKRFPNSSLAITSMRAYCAVEAGDKPNAKKYFSQTQGKVDLSVWDSKDKYESFAVQAYLVQ